MGTVSFVVVERKHSNRQGLGYNRMWHDVNNGITFMTWVGNPDGGTLS